MGFRIESKYRRLTIIRGFARKAVLVTNALLQTIANVITQSALPTSPMETVSPG